MEEDIKILESFIQTNIDFLQVNKREIQAIENLIARNKELEREKLSKSGIYKFDINIENCIPKSKIKEKIEELNNKMAEQLYIIKEFGESKGNREKLTMYKEQRDILGELLEENKNE